MCPVISVTTWWSEIAAIKFGNNSPQWSLVVEAIRDNTHHWMKFLCKRSTYVDEESNKLLANFKDILHKISKFTYGPTVLESPLNLRWNATVLQWKDTSKKFLCLLLLKSTVLRTNSSVTSRDEAESAKIHVGGRWESIWTLIPSGPGSRVATAT